MENPLVAVKIETSTKLESRNWKLTFGLDTASRRSTNLWL